MKKRLLLFGLLYSQLFFPQDQLSETEKIERLINIWGLLKYQHPEVSKGTFDMNAEFIFEFDKISEIKTREQLNLELQGWLNQYNSASSKFKTNPGRLEAKNIFTKNADFTWIDNSAFSPELVRMLKEIQNNSNIGEHYANVNSMNLMVSFKNDKGLDQFDATKKSHRILFLSSYWNIMKYWNPNLYLTDTPWPEVLTEMIPHFLKNDVIGFEFAKDRLFSRINDSHADYPSSYLFSKKLNHYGCAGGRIVNDSVVITRLYNTELAQKEGIDLGDIIVSINSKSVKEYYTEKFADYYSSSNTNNLRSMAQKGRLLSGSEGDSIECTLLKKNGMRLQQFIKMHPSSSFQKMENYKQLEQPKTENFYRLNDQTGYLNLYNITKTELKQAFEEFKNTKGIVIDLRNYPRSITEADIADYLYPEKKVFIKILAAAFPAYGKYDIEAPLKLIKNPFAAGRNNKNYYKGKVVLLVNRSTASNAEFIGMAIQQAPNCITVGEQTFGAVMNRNEITLMDKTTIDFTGQGAFYPDGTNVQRNGLKIDYPVTESALHYNPNSYLEKAVELIGQ